MILLKRVGKVLFWTVMTFFGAGPPLPDTRPLVEAERKRQSSG